MIKFKVLAILSLICLDYSIGALSANLFADGFSVGGIEGGLSVKKGDSVILHSQMFYPNKVKDTLAKLALAAQGFDTKCEEILELLTGLSEEQLKSFNQFHEMSATIAEAIELLPTIKKTDTLKVRTEAFGKVKGKLDSLQSKFMELDKSIEALKALPGPKTQLSELDRLWQEACTFKRKAYFVSI